MSDKMLKVENVSKQYRLGAIGGATLKEELQSLGARIRGKENPNLKIGQTSYTKNETFWALKDVSFEVSKGEAVGIIGRNGAGKSTILKLISRITAPTKGNIYLNGRITSMLEVGTGFHPELTGRENVYLNGAILGMTKREIDSKFDEIVEFSEISKFIDTPVKRYSSGMYVKLAFSVAANLDSEIMIMDEVLAVGDANFQQKCLTKMREVANEKDRTILYVSHNMNTIRQLCDRCIVLDKGEKIYDGDVDKAIGYYVDISPTNYSDIYQLEGVKRLNGVGGGIITKRFEINNKRENNVYSEGESIFANVTLDVKERYHNLKFMFIYFSLDDTRVAMSESSMFECDVGEHTISVQIPTDCLRDNEYKVELSIFSYNSELLQARQDGIRDAFCFQIITDTSNLISSGKWISSWGNMKAKPITIDKVK